MSYNFKTEECIYLNVPFAEKDECKELGAWWSKEKRKWFVNPWVQKNKPEETQIMVERWGEDQDMFERLNQNKQETQIMIERLGTK